MNELDFSFTMRDELIAILSRMYPAHLQDKMESDMADWPHIVCIHAPEGYIQYHISEDRIGLFKHLSTEKAHWDGSGPEMRSKRLERIAKRLGAS
jgi:hypothetical protein